MEKLAEEIVRQLLADLADSDFVLSNGYLAMKALRDYELDMRETVFKVLVGKDIT